MKERDEEQKETSYGKVIPFPTRLKEPVGTQGDFADRESDRTVESLLAKAISYILEAAAKIGSK